MGARPSDDPRAFLAPVGVADQALVELAGRVAGQLLHEIDHPRRLHVAEVGAAEGTAIEVADLCDGELPRWYRDDAGDAGEAVAVFPGDAETGPP